MAGIKLDLKRLLGFRLVADENVAEAAPGEAMSVRLGAKLGDKVGNKTGRKAASTDS